MKTTLLSTVVLALCAFGALGSPVEERAADSGFVNSCSNTSLNPSTVILTTTCRNSEGDPITSTISLDSCIANSNGQLVARFNGGFSASCPDRTFIGTPTSAELTCDCKNDAGNLVSTSIDLNSVFTNNNGILTCP